LFCAPSFGVVGWVILGGVWGVFFIFSFWGCGFFGWGVVCVVGFFLFFSSIEDRFADAPVAQVEDRPCRSDFQI